MSLRRPYDKFMVHQGLMRDPKVRRLLDPEFRALMACMCLASQSPERGVLLVSLDQPLTAAEVADEAGGDVTEEIAQNAIDKLVLLGTIIVVDPESKTKTLALGNWGRYNPAPKPSDLPENAAERKRRQRDREKAEAAEQLALEQQAERLGQRPQMVMDEQRSAPVRAVADDGTNRACPVATCNAQEGEQCRDRNGKPKGKPHAKRLRAPDQDAFFRVTRDREPRELAPADVDGWAPIAAVLRESVVDFKYGIWLAPLELVGESAGVEGLTLYVRAPQHQQTWIRDKYLSLIADAARQVRGDRTAVQIVDEQWRPAERAA